MNRPQRIVLALSCLWLTCLFVWVPFLGRYPNRPKSGEFPAGYGFVWSRWPTDSAFGAFRLDVNRIAICALASAAVGAAAFVLAGLFPGRKDTPSPRERHEIVTR